MLDKRQGGGGNERDDPHLGWRFNENADAGRKKTDGGETQNGTVPDCFHRHGPPQLNSTDLIHPSENKLRRNREPVGRKVECEEHLKRLSNWAGSVLWRSTSSYKVSELTLNLKKSTGNKLQEVWRYPSLQYKFSHFYLDNPQLIRVKWSLDLVSIIYALKHIFHCSDSSKYK